MDRWIQRPVFKAKVNAYRKEFNLRREEVADLLGLEDSHLRGLMYDKRTTITLEVAQKSAEIFKVPITVFVDDPGTPQMGIDARTWADGTPADRILASAIFADLLSLPEDVKAKAITLWKSGLDMATARQAAEKGKKQN